MTTQTDVKRGPRPKKALPTNRISFAKQLHILRAWGIAGGPDGVTATNKAVADLADMKSDSVSLVNVFFAECGLLVKTDLGYAPTRPTLDFVQAYEWMPETAALKLATAFESSWFGVALIPKLRIGPKGVKEALSILALASGAGPSHEQQLQLVLDYMEAAGQITIEGGSIKLAQQSSTGSTSNPTPAPSDRESVHTSRTQRDETKSASVTTSFAQPTEGQVQFNVSVRIGMTEFAGWDADRISAFFNGIAEVLAAKSGVERDASEE